MKNRILVVDDNRLIVTLLKVNLTSAGYEVVTASDGLAGLKAAIAERPDLIILDVMMPEMDGFEVARQVRNNTLVSHVPIIMLTARNTSESIVAGLDAGADDYLAKPFDMTEVLARVKAHLRRSRTERSLNPITNLPGNIAIEEKLKQLAASLEPFAVIYTDIDNFKSYNDAYGFLQGDVVLRTLGLIILQCITMCGNPHDFVGHIGGDDFVICSTPDKVDALCQQLITSFDELMPKLYNENDRKLGYVLGHSRDGQHVKHPLITVSLAVVTNEYRSFDSSGQISELVAEVKCLAKQMPHSIYIKDLRSSRASAQDASYERGPEDPPLSVALVCADRTLRLVLPVTLGRAKIKVMVCDTVAEALRTDVNTVIVDDVLLDESKLGVLAEAKENGRAVIVLGPPASDGDDLGATRTRTACLPKPYNFTHLASLIRQVHCCPAG
ncbi:MAG: Alkaline phosphatase synthesis transcriptional regulatory protein PhoP [Firmicutes bacterium]|nr:Alkaline phosphatase synthesis transcriptional regulatory protein PhoP [Bacillota bacterium]